MAGHSNGGQGLKQAVMPQKKRTRKRRVKSKAVPLYATEALGRMRHSSYSFSTSAPDGGAWSASRPGRALSPGKDP
jgi:hypothetical protein